MLSQFQSFVFKNKAVSRTAKGGGGVVKWTKSFDELEVRNLLNFHYFFNY
jgi:hypothetical protein